MKKICFLPGFILMAIIFIQCTEDSLTPDTKSEGDFSLTYSDGIGGTSSGTGSGGDTTQTPVKPGQITAAEWNDLMEWDFWIDLGQNSDFNTAKTNWNFEPSDRYSFLVKDSELKPVIDCEILLKNIKGEVLWKARTDNEGRAELWMNMNGGDEDKPIATIKYKSEEVNYVDPVNYTKGVNEVILATRSENLSKVDILFVVDATGSMGDEITYLKSELLDVIRKSEDLNGQLSMRVGSVFYRDEGDEYLTRVSAFSNNVNTSLSFINQQEAGGGGDYEEAVHTALSTAITQLSWSSAARARLLFLLLDAPPHHTEAIVNELNDIIFEAASKGIKIIPLSASGINKDSEFLFRFFAVATNGTYVFITNDSGIGGDHIEATVGDYEVEFLNDLIVRLISKYTL